MFLFDEPLSNLDAKLRVAMRAEIKALHQRLKTTTVYVTHDQVEAMTMADRIVVMHDGRIEQIGTPLELYDRPDNLFVAQFIGSPAMNVVKGTVRRAAGAAHVEVEGGAHWPLDGGPGADGQAVAYGIRPEHLTLAPSGNGVPGEIIVVEPTGAETELLIQVGGAGDPAHARPAPRESRRKGPSRRRSGQRAPVRSGVGTAAGGMSRKLRHRDARSARNPDSEATTGVGQPSQSGW